MRTIDPARDLRTSARRSLLALACAVGLALTMVIPLASASAEESAGGPVILMGLDSELEPGQSGHGPPEEHADMIASLLDAVTNGGEGLLVVGPSSGGVYDYWVGDIGDPLGVDITFVNGVDDILDVDLDGFAAVAVASSTHEIPNGVTNEENEALIERDLDIAEFVNDGGGLIGKTADGFDNPYGYVGPLGQFDSLSVGFDQFSEVEVTPAGEDLGLTTEGMSGWCCWHDVFLDFPDFMEVLVVHDEERYEEFGEAAAIGGVDVTIPTGIDLEPDQRTRVLGESHEVRAQVEQDDAPAEGVEVTFEVIDGPNEGDLGTEETNEDGEATLSYSGTEEGSDTIVATFVDRLDRERTSNEVTVEWLPEPGSLSLSPSEASGEIGEEHAVTVTLVDDDGEPVEGDEVTIAVADGPHEGTTTEGATDGDGQLTLTYEGDDVGTDEIVATHTTEAGEELSATATMEWSEVLGESEEADDEDDEVEDVEEAEPADPVEDDPDYTG